MTTPERSLIIRGPEPLLYVSDINRSVAFYCDTLGFKLLESYRPEDKLCWCRVARGGSALMLQQVSATKNDEPKRGHGIIFYFLCADANAIHAELKSAGLELEPPKTAFYGMNQLEFPDPVGYALCFQSIAG